MAEHTSLGGTISIGEGIAVPRLGYGAMRLPGAGARGEPVDREAAIRVLLRARELGVTFFDTAWAYGPETNETLIADALQPYGDTVVATKAGIERDGPRQWRPNGRPERLREMAESSLKRLGVDELDLLQLHAPDDNVPFEDSVGALAELQAEGKARNIGLSNVSVEQLRVAQTITTIASVQNHYNLAHSEEHEDVLRACETQNIPFLAYRPVAGGDLARKGGALARVAERHNATTAQVSIAWLLHRSPVIVPIPGTSSIEHLEENVAAARFTLTPEDVTELTAMEL